jgi:WD40 repeat protein
VVADVAGNEVTARRVELSLDEVAVDLAFNATGRELAAVTASGVEIASAEDEWQAEPASGLYCSDVGTPTGVAYLARGMVAVASQDGSVQVCETAPSSIGTLESPVYAVAVDPEGERVVGGDDAGDVVRWELGDPSSMGVYFGDDRETHRDYVNDVDYSPNGVQVATASGDGRGAIWDDEGNPTWLVGHDGQVVGVDFSPRGRRVATASTDGTVAIWDAATGAPVRSFTAHENGAWDVVFSPDDEMLASVGDDDAVRLWDPDSGDALGELRGDPGHTGLVLSVIFDPDGELLATTGSDGTTIIWDVDDREVMHRFDDHDGPVLSAAFHPTEDLVATASDDNTVLVYDRTSGDLERRIELPSPAYSVAFTPDGDDIVIGTGSGRIVVGPGDTDELVEQARERARVLTADECERFLQNRDCAADADIGY